MVELSTCYLCVDIAAAPVEHQITFIDHNDSNICGLGVGAEGTRVGHAAREYRQKRSNLAYSNLASEMRKAMRVDPSLIL